MVGDRDDVGLIDDEDDFDDDELDGEFEDFEDTTQLEVDSKSSNVGDASVELNVEELIAEIEAESGLTAPQGKSARKRLEALLEERRAARELDEWDEYALDDF